jgi:uncharacterized protein with ParB-like and HNH nuclease domain
VTVATGLTFEPIGLGDLLRRSRHVVPPNQRSYAWEERNVLDLLQDINGEIYKDPAKGTPEYFLGTIVLVDGGSGKPPQISDGQQRMATTTIILCRIRDLLTEIGETARASAIEHEYIAKIDLASAELKPQISLNTEDNAFFSDVILKPYPHDEFEHTFLRASNRRLLSASKTAYEYLKDRISGFRDDLKAAELTRWVFFIKEKTHAVSVSVPDENQAFRLFETLNDRGVKASQVDILKNFFLQLATDRLDETHSQWNELTGKIEAYFQDKDDITILYLRHLWITRNGHTTEKELSSRIRAKITSSSLAANFVSEANNFCAEYTALSDSSHPKWIEYKYTTREYLNTITRHLKIEQIKPLLFAISMRFSPDEADKAFRLAVSMSVRFLIFGGRGGFLDEHYASRAHEIGTGKITKARELRESLLAIVPTDAQFEEAFASARVSKSYLARYFLRSIDKTLAGDPNPEFVANEDYEGTNLEHIVPLRPAAGWGLSADELANVQNLLGNMTLISSKKNVSLGNKPFNEKVEIYKTSGFRITNQLEGFGAKFGLAEAKARQVRFAQLAVKTWSMKFE